MCWTVTWGDAWAMGVATLLCISSATDQGFRGGVVGYRSTQILNLLSHLYPIPQTDIAVEGLH